jgi:hypothetical protein
VTVVHRPFRVLPGWAWIAGSLCFPGLSLLRLPRLSPLGQGLPRLAGAREAETLCLLFRQRLDRGCPGWRACVVGVRRARPLVPVAVARLAGPVVPAAFSTRLPSGLLSWLRAAAPRLELRIGAITAACARTRWQRFMASLGDSSASSSALGFVRSAPQLLHESLSAVDTAWVRF